jgi:hypothetical protein
MFEKKIFNKTIETIRYATDWHEISVRLENTQMPHIEISEYHDEEGQCLIFADYISTTELETILEQLDAFSKLNHADFYLHLHPWLETWEKKGLLRQKQQLEYQIQEIKLKIGE